MSDAKRTVWIAYTNTDCTEGRGYDIPIAVCATEATARRLAKGKYVQGTNGPVQEAELVKIDGKWYAPGHAIHVIEATREDEAAQERLTKNRELLQRAKDAGLSDEDIRALAFTGDNK